MVNILSPINKGFEKYFTRMWDFTWRVSDCEGLVGVTQQDKKEEGLR